MRKSKGERYPGELLYANDLALVSEIFEGLKGRLEHGKEHWSQKGYE